MRLVFIGASRFGLQCLEVATRVQGVDVVGVVTAPATFSISYRPSGVKNVLHADVASFAEERGIPSVLIDKGMGSPELLRAVQGWRPEAFLVSGWYHMIPRTWRDIAPAFGLHASLLPDYSGGAPLVWAMINGEERTGITMFRMDDGVDSGPIVGQLATPIYPDDTIATLYERISELGLQLVREHLPAIASESLVLRPQDEAGRRVFRQRGQEDGLIDWSKSATEIDRFIRAQTRPYPGAFSLLGDGKLSVWRAEVADTSTVDDAAGRILWFETGPVVTCGKGRIRLLEVSYGERDYGGSELGLLFGAGVMCFDV